MYSLFGIGFGPSALSLAIAMKELNFRGKLGFAEQKRSFGWHKPMLLEDAKMQVSFLKDLVTPRNPASQFTFTSYLKARGRLELFINRKTFFPTRHEFSDYLEWAAAQFADQVAYDSQVVRLTPNYRERKVSSITVSLRSSASG